MMVRRTSSALEIDVARAVSRKLFEERAIRFDIYPGPAEIVKPFGHAQMRWITCSHIDIEAISTAAENASKHDVFEVLGVGNHTGESYFSFRPGLARSMAAGSDQHA